MTDIYTKDKRSKIMSNIGSVSTKPEIIIRKSLFSKGFRYRINYKKLPGKPDIVLPKYRTVIFVHGSFWHAHSNRKDSHLPKSNIEFWENKISSNINRDKNNIEQLVDLKWNIIVIWECEIKKKSLESLIEEVANCILTKTSR